MINSPRQYYINMLKRVSVAAAAATTLYLYHYLQAKRQNDLILHGRMRLAVAILKAIVDRLLLLPLRRAYRHLSLFTNSGMPQPGYISDLTDSKGAAFITNVLRAHFNNQNITVQTITVTPFSAGQMSNSARIDIKYRQKQSIGSIDGSASVSGHNNNDSNSNSSNNNNCYSSSSQSAVQLEAYPPSLVVKMTRQDIRGKALNMLVGLYRECACYSNLIPSTGCPVPVMYFSSVDEFSKDFLLILSDGSYLGPEIGYVQATTVGALSLAKGITTDALKAPGEPVEVYSKVPPTDQYGLHVNIETIPKVVNFMKKAVVELAKMHIKYWGDETLFEMDLSLANRNSLAEAYAAIQSSWSATKVQARSGQFEGTSPWRNAKDVPAFESLVERTLMAHLLRWGKVHHNDPTAWSRIDDESYRKTVVAEIGGKYTLLHGDFHSENVFVRSLPKKADCNHSEFLILDWQMPSIGDPVKDVARMPIFGALDHLGRAKYEQIIVRSWWEAFTSEDGGVPKHEYPWEAAWLSYRYWAAHHAALLIMSSEISKFFIEDGGAGYRMAVDKFNAVVSAHGDPTETFEKRAQELAKLDYMY